MLPTGKQLFVENLPIDLNALTSNERIRVLKRKSYWKHKEAILAKMKEKYDSEKEAKLALGILPGKRGRKKKYLSDEEILAQRDKKLTEKLIASEDELSV
jgi:transposase